MEGNNNIFLVGDDALGYLAQLMYKKYSMTFIWDHLFSKCGSYDQFLGSLHIPLVRTCKHLEYPCLLHMWSHQFDAPSSVLSLLVCHSFLTFIILPHKFKNLWLTLNSLYFFCLRHPPLLGMSFSSQ